MQGLRFGADCWQMLLDGDGDPDEKFRTEQGFVSMVPLQLYVWKDDDEWKLKDVTNPAKPFTYSHDAKPGETLPPLALFTKLRSTGS